MDLGFRIADGVYKISVEFADEVYTVRHGTSEWNVEFHPVSDNLFSLRMGSKIHRVYIVESKGKKYLSIMGQQFCVEKCETSRRRSMELDEMDGAATICSPMPGMVVKINVSEGDMVQKRQRLAIVEAMKMENELRSPIKGKVKKVHASAGDLVDAGKPIIELEAN